MGASTEEIDSLEPARERFVNGEDIYMALKSIIIYGGKVRLLQSMPISGRHSRKTIVLIELRKRKTA